MKGKIRDCDLSRDFNNGGRVCSRCPFKVAFLNPFSLGKICQDYPSACFNCRRCFTFGDFWDRIANGWAENEKRIVNYGACYGDCDICIDAKDCLGDEDDGEGDDW